MFPFPVLARRRGTLFLAAISLAASTARADDLPAMAPTDSEALQPAAPAKNPPGVTFRLRALDGKTRFQQGETIRLAAVFSSDRSGYKLLPYVTERDAISLRSSTMEVSPSQGTANPTGELPPQHMWTFTGPPPPAPVALSEKPLEIPFILNKWVRFDRPGIYRVSLTTRRVLQDTGQTNHRFAAIFGGNALETTSEALQLEIVPADPAWARAQVQAYREHWKRDTTAYPPPTPPQNDIGFLGTREAMEAIIERLGQGKRPRSSDDESWKWRPALVGFADRQWLVAAMERALARPDYPVTHGFLDTLSLLAALQSTPRPAGADESQPKFTRGAKGEWISHPTPSQQVQMDWEKRFARAQEEAMSLNWNRSAQTVALKSASARAMSLHTLLELAWMRNLGKEATVQARVPQLVTLLAPVFDQLPPLPQRYLLGNSWANLKSPLFLPALRRLWNAPSAPLEDSRPDLNDLLLRRFYELSPDEGRAIILRQIATPRPRVSIAALQILPDATLPALDQKLVDNLENPRLDDELSAQLIARYASAAVAPRLKKMFGKSDEMRDISASAAIHAYFLRVDPAFAKQGLEADLARVKKSDYSSLLSETAAQRMTPLLEQIAIAHLNNAGMGVAIDAAQTLGRYGSPQAEAALIARLKRTADARYPKIRERVETALVDALADAQSWLFDVPQLQAIRALCLTTGGQSSVDEYIRSRSAAKVHVHYLSGERGDWNVEHYIGQGLENLRAKLAQFPRGTVFSWQTLAFDEAEVKTFRALQEFVNARGMKLERS